MKCDPSTLDQSNPRAQLEKKFPIAILLGLLTFVVTPVISTIIAIPFYFLGKLSESFNALRIVTDTFGFREITGFFQAYFLLLGFLALVGNLATAVISWYINRSRQLAVVTFVSALIFEGIAVAFILSVTTKQSREIKEAGIERLQAYRQAATMGNPGFSVHEPYTDAEIVNRRPEFGPLYKKLRIVVPVSVSRAGAYRANVSYRYSKAGEWGHPASKETMKTLDVGDQVLEVEFVADGTFGFWSPELVGGSAVIGLYYVASAQEVLNDMNAGPSIDNWYIPPSVKDGVQSLKKSVADSQMDKNNPAFNKHIDRKEVYF